ncbi:tryptophan-rich sensory protein [Tellurirhabdus bombi]|uniref:tryptophan-rich sensory protein n=1 Tax=Tellurirhabdus bombi TaxID=2907205 RepID=UPI001F3397FB|nr:tryptophan-rich sensory protein [Tellurirhabdus bombi]
MKKPSVWRIATAVFVIGSIVYTSRSGQRSAKKRKEEAEFKKALPEYGEVFEQNLIIPAGWTFGAVWSTIYTGTAALSIHQALPDQVDNPRYRKAMPWLAASYVFNTLFGYFFSDPRKESRFGADLVTKLNLPIGLALHQSLEIGKTEVESPEKYLRIPVSLYAGWLTAASVVGTPNVLLDLGVWRPDARRDVPLSIGILGATGGAGYFIARQLNDPYYMLPFVAGFAGIASRQYGKRDAVAIAAGGLALAYVAILAKWLPRKNFRPLSPPADAPAKVIEIEPFVEAHENEIQRERMKEINPTLGM